MVKTLHILFLTLLLAFSGTDASAKIISNESEEISKSKTDQYIAYVYNKIKFTNSNKLRFEVFRTAFYGYLNMREAGKINREGTLSVCDFTLSSNRKRLWVIDLKSKKVLIHSLVAHGAGTGEEYATAFSNINDSHQSSLGFYVTGQTYQGDNGYSLKLDGVDGQFNSNAYDRAIVIHGAAYVSEQFAKENVRLGRSHGCPALPVETAPVIIDKIKNGTCFFIYHKANNYLSSSKWLRTSVRSLPQEADMMDLHTNESADNAQYAFAGSDNNKETPEGDIARAEPKRVVSSVILVNMNTRSGVSDTTVIK